MRWTAHCNRKPPVKNKKNSKFSKIEIHYECRAFLTLITFYHYWPHHFFLPSVLSGLVMVVMSPLQTHSALFFVCVPGNLLWSYFFSDIFLQQTQIKCILVCTSRRDKNHLIVQCGQSMMLFLGDRPHSMLLWDDRGEKGYFFQCSNRNYFRFGFGHLAFFLRQISR